MALNGRDREHVLLFGRWLLRLMARNAGPTEARLSEWQKGAPLPLLKMRFQINGMRWLPLVDTFRTFYLIPSSKNMRLIERYRSLRGEAA
jgi:hypothetical protein